LKDWAAWHEDYDDPSSVIARRLEVVRRLVGRALEGRDRVRVLALCAGDGRDLLPVLAEWGRDATGRLIELNEGLAARARETAASLGLDGIEVIAGDASVPENYAGAAPADLVMACGIFGNVSEEDIHRTIGALPALCRQGGCVVWTRHRRDPDLTPALRGWFADAGFEEIEFASPGPGDFSVGLHRLAEPLFRFVR
jgi:Methyltransferase domain